MAKEIELPDGSIAEFPDDMDDAAIRGVLQKKFPAPASAPVQELGPRDNTFLAEARRQLGLGARTLVNAAASPLTVPGDALAKAMNAAVGSDAVKPVFGLPSQQVNQVMTSLGVPEAERPIERFTQDVSKTLVPSMLLPAGLATQVAGNAAIGAAAAPQGQEGSGAMWGGVGGAAGHVLSKAIGTLTPTAEAEKLIAKGVPLTYGQRLGPPVQSLENTLARVPYVGAPIRKQQQAALEGWQQATRNEAVPGMATIDDVGGALGKQYKELVGNVKFDHTPNVTVDALVESASKTPGSTPSMLKTLGRELEDLKGQFTDASPATFHKAESTLKQLAFKFKGSPNPEQKIYGDMLADAAGGLRESWRSALPPATQDALAKVDAAYAQFVPIRSASTKYVQTLDDPENYTPRMLLQALRQKDTTLGKSQFRETPQGSLAQAGEAAIGSRSNAPNTGSGIGSLILGGGASALGHTPEALLAASLGAAYGTKTGQQVMIGSLPLQRALIDALRRSAPAVALQGTREDE